ncbi:SLC13 family permease [Limnoraphis robusta Tam1]|uniref:SLC13 family permease n=1 Tax=Limnoraphis robusta TaxID=1118279 RepID=UPI002B1FBB4F|nr:SLC13 family permease [Limnoraphis robusta]MEA5540945.1 SLC13 family permease [Limnoraphis robusta Tam1]
MEIVLTLGILVIALTCFIFELLPVDTTAICVAVVLMIFGLVTPEEGIAGFGNSATITVMAMFILSAGITRTGVVQIARDGLTKWGGNNLTQQIIAMGVIVGPISGLINNTAVVAIFLPIIEDWCKKQRISVSKLLMPLSFVTILGGMITLIGTSTNILASGVSKKLGYGEFSIFQFTKLGILTFLIGLVYLAFIAPKLLPNRKPLATEFIGEDYDIKDYLTELIIKPRSSLVGQTLSRSEIQRKFDLDVLEIVQNGMRFSQPLGDKVLGVGDILIVRSGKDDLLKIREERGLSLLPDVQFQTQEIESILTTEEEKIGEVLILSNSRLIGTTLKELRFRQRYNATVLAIRRGAELLRGRLGRIPLRFGDLLLVQGPKQSFIGLQTTRELLVLEQQDVETLRTDKALIAVLITLAVIGVAAFDWLPILITGLTGVILMIITGCLKPGEIYGAVRWDVIFLLAGLIPLGTAMDKSGATELLGNFIAGLGGNLSGYWILTFFFAATSVLTEILSNNASVVLMIPIAVQVAETLNLNPLAFMFAVTFAASNSFMTPIGYQTNTMVYGPGGYKFVDFLRVGGPLNLLMAIVTPLLIVWLYGLEP